MSHPTDDISDPATTVHLMLLQPLARVALSGLRHVTQLGVSGEAVRKAKGRLPLAAVGAVHRRAGARRGAQAQSREPAGMLARWRLMSRSM